MTPAWNPLRVRAYYDEYGEREWTRFEDGREPATCLGVYVDFLRRFVGAGDRVLEVGSGPGRFTIELARLGANVVVVDISPGQLELNRSHVRAAGFEERVLDRIVADVTDLSRWENSSFDAVVCFGGPLSYVLDRVDTAIGELVRVAKPGRCVLAGFNALAGAMIHYLPEILDLVRRDGAAKSLDLARTGILPEEDPDYGHLTMKLYRWSEVETLLSRHGTILAAAGVGLFPGAHPKEGELRDFVSRLELEFAQEPGALSCGQHILAAVRKRT